MTRCGLRLLATAASNAKAAWFTVQGKPAWKLVSAGDAGDDRDMFASHRAELARWAAQWIKFPLDHQLLPLGP